MLENTQQMRLQAQVIANMAEGVIMVSAETATIVYANPRMEYVLGYASGQLAGKAVHTINAASEADPVQVAQAIIAELHQHGQWRGEVKNLCADGTEIWTTCTVSEFHHEGYGKVWVAVHTDINDQRLAQHARDDAFAQLRRLSLNVQDTIEAERLALSRDVHDQLGAALTGIRMKLESLAQHSSGDPAALASALLELADTVRSTQLAARDICTRLRPQVLDDMGLVEACRWYLADWSDKVGIAAKSRFVRFKVEPDGNVVTDMFRVMQELLTNVARHAGASQVQLSLSGGPHALKLQVQDDGHGFAVGQASPGFGLMGVQERVRHHGGQFLVESSASGTRITVTMQNLTVP